MYMVLSSLLIFLYIYIYMYNSYCLIVLAKSLQFSSKTPYILLLIIISCNLVNEKLEVFGYRC